MNKFIIINLIFFGMALLGMVVLFINQEIMHPCIKSHIEEKTIPMSCNLDTTLYLTLKMPLMKCTPERIQKIKVCDKRK